MSTGIYKRHKIEPFILFIKRVTKTKECWYWNGYKDKLGYGKFKHKEGSLAHRFSFIHYSGNIPEGRCVCHYCDNPSCVNPKHLWLGTVKENNKDCIKKNRSRHISLVGEDNGKSKFTEQQIIKIKEMSNKGLSQKKISTKFGCHQTTIHYILSNKTWKHVK